MMIQSNEIINRANDMIANRQHLMTVYEIEQNHWWAWDTEDYIIADKIMHNVKKPVFSLLTDLLK